MGICVNSESQLNKNILTTMHTYMSKKYPLYNNLTLLILGYVLISIVQRKDLKLSITGDLV